VCVLAIASAVYGYGCSVYDSTLLLPGASDSGAADVIATDSRADAHDSGAIDTGPGVCAEATPPDPPTQDDPSDAGEQTFVVALHTIDVGLSDAGTIGLGYDLDKVYTHTAAPACGPESCKAAVVGSTHPDTPGGRDDSAGELIGTLAGFDPTQFNTTTVSQRLQNGTYSVLLQILHYNGTPNDTQVSVGLYASTGIEGDAGAAWNGNDSWTIDQGFVVNGDASPILPNHLDGAAYVTNGTLVMHVNFPISLGSFSSGTFSIALTAGLITGKIVPAGSGYALAGGQITGRWRISDLLQAVQAVTVGGNTLCPGSTYYSLLKTEACQYADIMTDPMQDNTMATCDALSLGIGFSADPALLGPVVSGTPKASPCGDAATAPDNCGM
jgi:hypothetical protein